MQQILEVQSNSLATNFVIEQVKKGLLLANWSQEGTKFSKL